MIYPQATPTRTKTDLNGIWNFSLEQDGIDYTNGFAAEKQVAVPGSFNDQFVDEELRVWMKGMWVSRQFFMPAPLKNERIMLRFGSVNYRAEVFLNGTRLGSHETGYTPFEFDITDTVDFESENLLCVRIDNQLSCDTVPMGQLGNQPEAGQFAGQYPDTPFDFFPYAGIHRPVIIYTTSRTAWLNSIRITTALDGTITFHGEIGGSAATAELSIRDAEGSVRINLVDGCFNAQHKIENVQLWDVDQPNLYHAVVRLFDAAGMLVDETVHRFGVRTVSIENNRLQLNGKPVYLKGFGRHEDFPIIGKGLNDCVNVRDHEMLRWINANSYRTTHYPYSEELVRLCDEQGILLIAEAPAVSINFEYATERTLDAHKQALRELIERDRNSPSVVMWSVANEATSDRDAAKPYFKALAELTREIDPTRPVTFVSCKADADCCAEFFDVFSVNMYPGWYHLPGQTAAARDDLRTRLTSIYEKFGKPVFVTEFGADTIAGFHSLPAEQWSEEYQTELILALIDEMRQLDFVMGEHIWNFADFRTAQNFVRAGGNKKGVFTRDRQPKMAAHFLRRKWEED